MLIAQFWTGFAPVGWENNTPAQNTTNFFEAYLAAPLVLVFYVPYKLYYRTKVVRLQDMDLQTGMRELNLEALLVEEREESARWPAWKKVYKFLC